MCKTNVFIVVISAYIQYNINIIKLNNTLEFSNLNSNLILLYILYYISITNFEIKT